MDCQVTRIRFIEHNGTEQEVEAENGHSLMLAAINNLVPGIDADCGGECACATCHVILSEDAFATLGPPGEAEEQMLDLNPERSATSRLSCQIPVTDELDGLMVQLPEFQF